MRKKIIYIVVFFALPCAVVFAQDNTAPESNVATGTLTDSVSAVSDVGVSSDTESAVVADKEAEVERTVYVEREFQPVIQAAGKIAVKPGVYEPQIVLRKPEYSNFTSPLEMDYNVRKISFSTLNFRHSEPLHGFMKAGVGHANSLFSFNYRVTDSQMQQKEKSSSNDLILDLHADHLAQWGLKARSISSVGFDFAKQLSSAVIFFGADGGNDFFSRYGMYYNTSTCDYSVKKLKDMAAADKQSLWTVDTRIGVKSLPNADIDYSVQTGYEAFIAPNEAVEHQIHTQGNFDWSSNFHHVGIEADIQNRFYSSDSLHTANNHRIHLEPYYSYIGSRIRAHAGVNLDFSAGRGRVAGISPNVRFEADLTQNWLAVYANVTGQYEANGARGEFRENIYRSLNCLYEDKLSGEYTPVNATVGFKIRPYATLLIDLHAGYKLTLDRHANVFSQEVFGQYEHELQNTSSWKIGADIGYHWRDIVELNVSGNYYINKALTSLGGLADVVFDLPQWDLRARVDVNINRKWAVYSDNLFVGRRMACVYDLQAASYSAQDLRPMIDLNLGVQYNVNRWLSVYAQLNNYLAWTESLSYQVFYGYEAARANCMIGLSWSF